jgi:hypothetical protein
VRLHAPEAIRMHLIQAPVQPPIPQLAYVGRWEGLLSCAFVPTRPSRWLTLRR